MARLKLHDYQERAVQDLIDDPYHGLFLDMGLGKTAIVITAFCRMRDAFDISRMLVIAPLRVCLSTWPEEAKKWGSKLRVHYLGDCMNHIIPPGDIFVINPERLGQLFGQPDEERKKWIPGRWRHWGQKPEMLVVDESTKFKKAGGHRAKTLHRYLDDFGRRVILTGSPTPNGLMDLHGQMMILDKGASLDKRVTYFQKEFFNNDGHGWKPQRDGEERIMEAIRPRVTVLRAEDYLELPEFIKTDVPVRMPDHILEALKELKSQIATEVDGVALVELSAALTKTRQLINGVVYTSNPFENHRKHKKVHDAKLDALFDILDEINRPAMVAYEFRCEREEIAKRLKKQKKKYGIVGGGVPKKDIDQSMKDWNAGKLDVLLIHPQSGGHGLNLQAGGNVVIWFSPPWDLEYYDQLNARLRRQGQVADKVFVYHLVGIDTADRRIARVLREKGVTQERILNALKREFNQCLTSEVIEQLDSLES